MRRVLVRYQVKPERLEEHEGLIGAVFRELAQTAPAGLRYGAYKEPDGVSFVHFAVISADKNPLDSLPAFKKFASTTPERCQKPPVVVELTEVGAFGF